MTQIKWRGLKIRSFAKLAQLAGLVVLGACIITFLPRGIGLNESVEPIYYFFIFTNFSLLLIAYITEYRSKSQSRLLSYALWGGTAIAALLAAPYIIGSIQDLFIHCRGFFGADTSCITSWQLSIWIHVFNPFVFIPLMAILTVLLVWGILRKTSLK